MQKSTSSRGEEKQAMTGSHTQQIFLALADPTRRLLLQQLCEEGSGTAANFAARLPITRQAIIKHLITLEQAGLVTAREVGRERRYVLRPEALQTVTTWIGTIEAHWDQHLSSLQSYLLDEQRTTSSQERANKHNIAEEKDK